MSMRAKERLWRRISGSLTAITGVVALAIALHHGPETQGPFRHADDLAHAIVGSHYLLLFGGFGLILVTRGLLHGKRSAWWAALVALIATLTTLRTDHHDLIGFVLVGVTTLTLLALRKIFRAKSDPALGRRGVYVLVVGELSMFAYAAIGLYTKDHEFRTVHSLGSSFTDAFRLLFLLPVADDPVSRHGHLFVDSVRGGALIIAIVGLVLLVSSVNGGPGHARDRRRVQELLEQFGNNGLAHFQLLDDKNWYFASDQQSFIGYKVVGTTAVGLGGPVGSASSCPIVLKEFLDFCDLNSWTPAFTQLTESERELVAAEMATAKIGEEAIVEIQTWSEEGKDYKSLRSALRRCERAGYEIIDLSNPLNDEDLARIKAVSDDWASDGEHRERTFTLGRFDADYLRSTQVVAVVDSGGTIQAFANLLPPYKDENASFDLMRRRHDAANGVMDFLFVGLIKRFAAEGYRGMNLGLAPFAGIEDDGSIKAKTMRLMYDRLSAVFNYPGLYAFKNKWHPRWEPRYLGYPSESLLPKVAAATARAGELPSGKRFGAVGNVVRRFPLSTAFIFFELLLMTATAVHPEIHIELLRDLGSNWQTLNGGELWRLFTSPLLQESSGYVWTNFALLIVVPLSEWRFKANHAALIYMCGDIVSTLSVLFALRIAEGFGNGAAHRALFDLDAGTSSGSLALLGATLWTIPQRRVRFLLSATLLLIMTAFVVFGHRMFDSQHLLASIIGVVTAALIARRAY